MLIGRWSMAWGGLAPAAPLGWTVPLPALVREQWWAAAPGPDRVAARRLGQQVAKVPQQAPRLDPPGQPGQVALVRRPAPAPAQLPRRAMPMAPAMAPPEARQQVTAEGQAQPLTREEAAGKGKARPQAAPRAKAPATAQARAGDRARRAREGALLPPRPLPKVRTQPKVPVLATRKSLRPASSRRQARQSRLLTARIAHPEGKALPQPTKVRARTGRPVWARAGQVAGLRASVRAGSDRE